MGTVFQVSYHIDIWLSLLFGAVAASLGAKAFKEGMPLVPEIPRRKVEIQNHHPVVSLLPLRRC